MIDGKKQDGPLLRTLLDDAGADPSASVEVSGAGIRDEGRLALTADQVDRDVQLDFSDRGTVKVCGAWLAAGSGCEMWSPSMRGEATGRQAYVWSLTLRDLLLIALVAALCMLAKQLLRVPVNVPGPLRRAVGGPVRHLPRARGQARHRRAARPRRRTAGAVRRVRPPGAVRVDQVARRRRHPGAADAGPARRPARATARRPSSAPALHLGKLAALDAGRPHPQSPGRAAAPRPRLVGHHARPVRRPRRPARRARAAASCARSRSWTRRRGGRSAARRTHCARPRRRGRRRGVARAAAPARSPAGSPSRASRASPSPSSALPATLEIVDGAGDGQDLRLADVRRSAASTSTSPIYGGAAPDPRSIEVLAERQPPLRRS